MKDLPEGYSHKQVIHNPKQVTSLDQLIVDKTYKLIGVGGVSEVTIIEKVISGSHKGSFLIYNSNWLGKDKTRYLHPADYGVIPYESIRPYKAYPRILKNVWRKNQYILLID